MVGLVLLIGCGPRDGNIVTLYRSSAAVETLRIHVATFDADEPRSYNEENCRTAAELFASQGGVTVRYFCELGRFRR